MAESNALPRPRPDASRVVVPAPGDGPGYWAGGPSAVAGRGRDLLARLPACAGRSVPAEGYANVVARSEDGDEFETVTVLEREEFGSDSLERPALVAAGDGTWKLYVSCATPGTDHWRVDVLDADAPSEFRLDVGHAPCCPATGVSA